MLAVRYGIGAVMIAGGIVTLAVFGDVMVLGGIVMLILSPGGRWVDGFAIEVGGGFSVLLLNFIYRVSDERDREREEPARAFDEHGDRPEDEPAEPRHNWVLPAGAVAQFTEPVATAVANAESGAELAASRRRIVATADQARRRLERDLHDGAQQRLVNTVPALKPARMELGDSNGSVAELMAEALANAHSVAALGGALAVNSALGAGTALSARISVAAATAAGAFSLTTGICRPAGRSSAAGLQGRLDNDNHGMADARVAHSGMLLRR
jgi:hypothetical protein